MSLLKKILAAGAASSLALGLITVVGSAAKAEGECSASGIATAEAPSFYDAQNSESGDTVTIPASGCVRYTINGVAVQAGTYAVSDYAQYAVASDSNGWTTAQAEVQAVAEQGYALSGYYLWRQGFVGIYAGTNAPVNPTPADPARPVTEVAAAEPTLSGLQVQIPSVEGVQYYANGEAVAAGSKLDLRSYGKLTVTVGALEGYRVTNAGAEWYFWMNTPAPQPTPTTPAPTTPAPTPTANPTTPAPQPTPTTPAPTPTAPQPTADPTTPAPQPTPTTPAPTTPAPTPTANPTTAAPKPVVAFVPPTFDPQSATYTIPSATGLEYYVDGKKLDAGTYDVTGWNAEGKAEVRITAKVAPGYKGENGYSSYSWTYGYVRAVTAKAPSFAQTGKVSEDSFTIPASAGIEYYAGGKKLAAGTYKVKDYASYTVVSTIGRTKIGSATLTVEARGATGYQVTGTNKWTQQFLSSMDSSAPVIPSDDSQTLLQASPKAPSYTAAWRFWFIKIPAKFTIPKVTGVDYYMDGQLLRPGTYKLRSGSVTIEAKPQAGYAFPSGSVTTTKWTFSG